MPHAFYGSIELAALCLVAVPLPVLAYHFWDQYAAASSVSLGLGARCCRCSAFPRSLFFGAVLLGVVAVYAIPRLCMLFLTPGKVYPTFGFHHLMQTIISRVSNARFYSVLFGDSSFITTYMGYVGWNMNTVSRLARTWAPTSATIIRSSATSAPARWCRTACR